MKVVGSNPALKLKTHGPFKTLEGKWLITSFPFDYNEFWLQQTLPAVGVAFFGVAFIGVAFFGVAFIGVAFIGVGVVARKRQLRVFIIQEMLQRLKALKRWLRRTLQVGASSRFGECGAKSSEDSLNLALVSHCASCLLRKNYSLLLSWPKR